MQYSIEELLNAGLNISDEQIDYYLHPERNEFAVVVFGVPDPDRLYITGPDEYATIYQIAEPGEPSNQHGYRACVLPVVICQTDADDGVREIEEYFGQVREQDTVYPFVTGHMEDNDWAWQWLGDDIPIMVAAWDLWPISADEVVTYATAARIAFEKSAMHYIFSISDLRTNGGELSSDELDDLRELLYLPRTPEERQQLESEIARLEQEEYSKLEARTIHPVHEMEDPQFPPVQLPPEQEALWTSLQRLSQYNWATLSRWERASADHNGRSFVEANRRLCPWY